MSGADHAERRAWYAVAPFSLVPALVVGLALALGVSVVVGVIVGVVLAAVLAAWARLGGDARVISAIGGREADPREDARFCNLVEGLSTTAGVRQPRLRVLDAPGINILVAGTRPSRGVIVATTGLLTELNRIELEAVLAEQLAQLRHGETLPATVLVATFGLGRNQALPPDLDARNDQNAVSITKYPPALASALEKMETKGTGVPAVKPYLSHLWMAEPGPDAKLGRGRLPLRDRIEALREL